MSGHSKFANIKHKKEKNDAAKGKIFTKIGKEIAVAVKEGGSEAPNQYLHALDRIIKDYAKRDVCAEAYLAKARYYRNIREYEKALQTCDEAINLYPDYKRISALRVLLP